MQIPVHITLHRHATGPRLARPALCHNSADCMRDTRETRVAARAFGFGAHTYTYTHMAQRSAPMAQSAQSSDGNCVQEDSHS